MVKVIVSPSPFIPSNRKIRKPLFFQKKDHTKSLYHSKLNLLSRPPPDLSLARKNKAFVTVNGVLRT